MKVLVVEDDKSVRETVGMVLELSNYDPDLVSDGIEAINYLRKQWPDVMLLDLSLPGMSGEEVYHKIREEFGKVPPTIVLSAVSKGAMRVQNLQNAWFLPKPYTIEELTETLDRVLSSTRDAA